MQKTQICVTHRQCVKFMGCVTHISQSTIVHEVFVDKCKGIGCLAPKCVCVAGLKWTGEMLQTPIVIPLKPEYSD
jgi:hypothetical protein